MGLEERIKELLEQNRTSRAAHRLPMSPDNEVLRIFMAGHICKNPANIKALMNKARANLEFVELDDSSDTAEFLREFKNSPDFVNGTVFKSFCKAVDALINS